MTQIEQIKAEIERLYCEEAEKYDTSQEIGAKRILDELSKYINTLPTEQPSEDLEEAANIYANKQGLELKPFAIKFFKSGAQWQKEQIMKSAFDAVIVNDEMSGCVVDCEQGCLVLEPHTYAIGQQLKILIIKVNEK